MKYDSPRRLSKMVEKLNSDPELNPCNSTPRIEAQCKDFRNEFSEIGKRIKTASNNIRSINFNSFNRTKEIVAG
jgi:hypothetical protein